MCSEKSEEDSTKVSRPGPVVSSKSPLISPPRDFQNSFIGSCESALSLFVYRTVQKRPARRRLSARSEFTGRQSHFSAVPV